MDLIADLNIMNSWEKIKNSLNTINFKSIFINILNKLDNLLNLIY